jgi:hypothetical protein
MTPHTKTQQCSFTHLFVLLAFLGDKQLVAWRRGVRGSGPGCPHPKDSITRGWGWQAGGGGTCCVFMLGSALLIQLVGKEKDTKQALTVPRLSTKLP